MANPTNSNIALLLDDARRKLLNLSARNPLVHFNRKKQNLNHINIVNGQVQHIFETLRKKNHQMKFKPAQEDTDLYSQEALFQQDSLENEVAKDPKDKSLETLLTLDILQRKLLSLYRKARDLEAEMGANILYLAMGFLTWYEDEKSKEPREAPLILLPVTLRQVTQRNAITVHGRDDDILTNLPLQERLKNDFEIIIPEIEDSDDWAPDLYLQQVATAVSGYANWKVDSSAILLGKFTFAKFLMWRDLQERSWPQSEKLETNQLVRSLLSGGFKSEPLRFDDKAKLDSIVAPADLIQVVDADTSQTKVIEEVRTGRNLVIQGPPGTGKSQTITNIIASAVYDGKTVLFMAEKMAALDVVHKRLKQCGLQDICLELHSDKSNKKGVIQEIDRTLRQGEETKDSPAAPTELTQYRDLLNQIAELLHSNIPNRDYSPFLTMAEISRFIGRKVPSPSIPRKGLENLSNKERDDTAKLIGKLADSLKKIGPPQEHSFAGITKIDISPPERGRLAQEIKKALERLAELTAAANDIAAQLSEEHPQTLRQVRKILNILEHIQQAPESIGEYGATLLAHTTNRRLDSALTTGAEWRRVRDAATGKFNEAAWNAPVTEIRSAIAKGPGSRFSRWFTKYDSASKELESLLQRPLPAHKNRLALIDELIFVQKKRELLKEDEPFLQSKLGEVWRGERTDFSSLLACKLWLVKFTEMKVALSTKFLRSVQALAPVAAARLKRSQMQANELKRHLDAVSKLTGFRYEGIDLADYPFSDLEQRIDRMRKEVHTEYPDWVTYLQRRQELIKKHLYIVQSLDDGTLQPSAAVDDFLYAVSEARWNVCRQARPELDKLMQTNRHLLTERFQKLEQSRFQDVRKLILMRHRNQLPKGVKGQMAYIRREVGKKARHMPIRSLMSKTGEMVRRIKPVFLMSPPSIAQFLPPGEINFDILVIDEASQVRPEDALGAIARVKQIVVVGDKKQLPPTGFFERGVRNYDDEDGDDQDSDLPVAKATEMESILTLCEARGINSAMLKWHYRSKHPSLIEISNKEFYEGKLVLLPPPAVNKDYGLKFASVPGEYTSGISRSGGTNQIEAEAIAEALADHARTSPELSVGIVAFSGKQQEMIQGVVDARRQDDEILDNYLREDNRKDGESSEDVFIKNIENVQGDERDVILISVGYGPDEANGRLSAQTFGPINFEGGERRLNVLFTRARARCTVYCSFDPGDIRAEKATHSGPRILKSFLDFAQSGKLNQPEPTGLGADSPFEEDVADVIQGFGYEAVPQVGTAGFRIDIGVQYAEYPGQYILAVECDGATYHSSLSARERDRHRQQILESHGWTFHRIWSTDWFNRRKQESNRLKQSLEQSKDNYIAQRQTAVQQTKAQQTNQHPTGLADQPDQAEPQHPGQTESPAIPEISAPAYLKGSYTAQRKTKAQQTNQHPTNSTKPKEPQHLKQPAPPTIPQLSVPAYRKATMLVIDDLEPHEYPLIKLVSLVVSIVETEGPIHWKEVARRVAEAFGKHPSGTRIQNATKHALVKAKLEHQILASGNFSFTEAQQQNPPVRNRSAESSPTTDAECLSALEIQSAARLISQNNGTIVQNELIVAIAQLMGYKRTGSDLKHQIHSALNSTEA